MKKTVVLGATPNPARYAYLAVERLMEEGIEVIPVGIRKGEIQGLAIRNDLPFIPDVDTITLYLNPEIQKEYYSYILSLQPKRIIFNPGAENPQLMRLAKAQGIEVSIACTLVLLSLNTY